MPDFRGMAATTLLLNCLNPSLWLHTKNSLALPGTMSESQDDYSVDEFDELSGNSTQDGSAEIDAILGPQNKAPVSSITISIIPETENGRQNTNKKNYKTPPEEGSPPKSHALQEPTVPLPTRTTSREPAYTLPVTTPKPKRIRKSELNTFLQRMDAGEKRRKQKIEKHQNEQAQDTKLKTESTCTWNATRNKATSRSAANSANTDRLQSFLQRQEAAERAKQEKLKRRAQEALYEASTTKSICPNCGSYQSYTEVLSNGTICANEECKGKFRYENPAAFRLEAFQERMERSSRRREQTVNRIKEEQADTLRVPICSKGRRQKQLVAKVDAKGKDFLARMNDDIARRRDKKNRVEKNLKEYEAETCTFQPKLNIAKNLQKKKSTCRAKRRSSSSSYRDGHKTDPLKNKRTCNASTKSGTITEWRKSTPAPATSEKIKLLHIR